MIPLLINMPDCMAEVQVQRHEEDSSGDEYFRLNEWQQLHNSETRVRKWPRMILFGNIARVGVPLSRCSGYVLL